MPLTPTLSGSVTAAHPRVHRGIDTAVSKEPMLAPSGSALDPQPLAIFPKEDSTAGSLLCWWFCSGGGRRRREKRSAYHFGLVSPSPTHTETQCRLSARQCWGSAVKREFSAVRERIGGSF